MCVEYIYIHCITQCIYTYYICSIYIYTIWCRCVYIVSMYIYTYTHIKIYLPNSAPFLGPEIHQSFQVKVPSPSTWAGRNLQQPRLQGCIHYIHTRTYGPICIEYVYTYIYIYVCIDEHPDSMKL